MGVFYTKLDVWQEDEGLGIITKEKPRLGRGSYPGLLREKTGSPPSVIVVILAIPLRERTTRYHPQSRCHPRISVHLRTAWRSPHHLVWYLRSERRALPYKITPLVKSFFIITKKLLPGHGKSFTSSAGLKCENCESKKHEPHGALRRVVGVLSVTIPTTWTPRSEATSIASLTTP